MADWPKWSDMNWLRLLEGPANLTVMDIAPTMKNLTVQGEKYFRMTDVRSGKERDDPARRTESGGAYLWDGYWTELLAKAAAKKAATGTEPGNG